MAVYQISPNGGRGICGPNNENGMGAIYAVRSYQWWRLPPLETDPQRTATDELSRSSKVNIDEAFPSKYLSAADIRDDEPIVTIGSIGFENVGDDRRLVIHFQEMEKPMVCNKTNAKRIAYIVNNNETDNWIGKQVKLYEEMVDFQGAIKPAIRIKAPPKAQQARPGGIKSIPPAGSSKPAIQDRGSYKLSTTQPTEDEMAGNG